MSKLQKQLDALIQDGRFRIGKAIKGRHRIRNLNYLFKRQKEQERFFNILDGHISSKRLGVSEAALKDYLQSLMPHIYVHSWTHLNELVASITDCSKFTDNTLNSFGILLIKLLKNVKSLSIILLWHIPLVTDQGLRNFGLKISRNLSHLQSLNISLNLYGCHITRKALCQFVSDIAVNIQDLKRLELTFMNFFSLSDECLKKIISQIASYLLSLQHLKILFKQSDSPFNVFENKDCQIQHLSRQKFANLESFLLNLENCGEITSEIFSVLQSKPISSFWNLRHLFLSFNSNYLEGKHIEAMGQFISQYASNLEVFALKASSALSDQKITDENVQIFGIQIIRNCRNLKKLYLSFNHNQEITDKSLELLTSEIIIHQKRLEELTVSFSDCPLVTQLQRKLTLSKLNFIPKLAIY